jgi:hypothetical protein
MDFEPSGCYLPSTVSTADTAVSKKLCPPTGIRRSSCGVGAGPDPITRAGGGHPGLGAPVPSAALGSCGLGVALALSRMFRGPGLLVVRLGVFLEVRRRSVVWLGARRLEALTGGLDLVLATGRPGQHLERVASSFLPFSASLPAR